MANLIAAGEVVERPASVVKELMENAIDAGSTALTVEIQHGGMSYIRVTDNGSGISPEDVETAFLRHATSKLRTGYDLEAIGTLGFRGEALAAIAAVSRVEVLTRVEGADFGVSLTLEGGIVKGEEEAGGPQGTSMVVRDLFFNTPARLKYMKKDTAEGAAVLAAVQREALAHPEVAVKFLRDGRQELITPGDGQLKSAVYAVLGRDLALGFTPVRATGEDGISVEGFASLPACCRGSRSYQFFFVNGRYIKSKTMMAGLEEAYKNQRMVGKFPGCILHVHTRLNSVDVNVHPAKTEVKFISEKRIFDAVYHAVKGTLEGETRHIEAALPQTKPSVRDAEEDQLTLAHRIAEGYKKVMAQEMEEPPARRQEERKVPDSMLVLHDVTWTETAAPPPVKPVPPPPKQAVEPPPAPVGTVVKPARPLQPPPPPGAEPPSPPPVPFAREEPEESAPEAPPLPWKVRGELFNTYIIVEQGEKALLIDKHAAHERMNFDALKARGYRPMVQSLLAPVVFTPPAEEGAALLAHLPLLEEFGFGVEDFGGGSLVVRQVPHDVDPGEAEAVLTELAAGLLTTGRADPDSVRDGLMHTMACKAAIKGGQKNGRAELEKVAGAVMRGEVKYCPHGRPVAIELTKGQLERQFKRA